MLPGMIRAYSYTVRDYTDLRIAVSEAQKISFVLEASDLDRSMIGTIVSELGSNIIKYAGYGTIIVRLHEASGQRGVEILAKDDGPGIANIDLALRDSFSTGHSLGLGLPGVKRMSDQFTIHSAPESGTLVSAIKLFRKVNHSALTISPELKHFGSTSVPFSQRCDIGAHQRPMVGQIKSGDLVVTVETLDHHLIAIIDVTGHGDRAHIEAHRIKGLIEAHADLPLKALVTMLHHKLLGTLGAAIGLLRIERSTNAFSYMAVGNTGASRVRGKKWRGISKDGVLGLRLPTLFEQSEFLETGDVLLLWTDGLSETAAPAYVERHLYEAAQPLAHRLLVDMAKDHDDAGCAIVKWFA